MNFDSLVGRTHTSEWFPVEQARINAFAEATEDRNPLHIDPQWCKAHSPYGVPIAHGFLTTSLLVPLAKGTIVVDEGYVAVNYGMDRLRLIGPVPVGSRIQGRFTITAVEPRGDDQAVVHTAAEVYIEGGEKPVLVADWLAFITKAR